MNKNLKAGQKRSVTILGSTGSIGTSTVDLLKQHPERYEVKALVGGKNVDLLAEQAKSLKAEWAVINDETAYEELKNKLAGTGIKTAAGRQAVIEAASHKVDWTMAAIIGAAGLEPTLASIRNGQDIALANKEALVCAGQVMLKAVKEAGATLLPVDSEHNAIAQSIAGSSFDDISHIILTASGGPFREFTLEQMATVTPEMALKHPTWSMGRKITIDSASMANKGLEVIEAARLFNLKQDQIQTLVHPQSTVHGMVVFKDGSVVSQMGAADMRIPIAHALGFPERLETNSPKLDLAQTGRLDFFEMDEKRFKPLALARRALDMGGAASAVFSAANEIAVEAFLEKRLSFLGIGNLIEETMDRIKGNKDPENLKEVLEWDDFGRRTATAVLGEGRIK